MSGTTSDKGGDKRADKPKGRVATTSGMRGKRVIARDAIAGAADILGGAEGLAAWALTDEKTQDKFWTTLYPKLLPLQVTGEAGGPIRIAAAIEAARKRVRAAESSDDDDKPTAEETA